MIAIVQAEPVRRQRRGKDVAVVLSPDEFRRLREAANKSVNPAVRTLHSESAIRWSKVYEMLAK